MLMLLSLAPSLITLPFQLHMAIAGIPPDLASYGWLSLGSALLSLLIVPLNAGYLQVVDAAERGLPTRALDIFKPYRHGEAPRLIGYGLVMFVVYLALLGIIIVAMGSGIVSWYVQVLAAQTSHQPPPGMPHGFGVAMALFMVLALFMMGFYAISLGQVALKRRNVFGAIGDGFVGALRNLLPLFVFALSAAIAGIAAMIAIVMLALLFVLLGKLAGAWLVLVLVVPLYFAMMLVTITAMFGVMHSLWNDVCGDDTGPDMPPALAA